MNGPVVLLVDSFTGTTGAQSPDGRNDDQPAKAFFDFTGTLTNGKLLPSEQSTKRTLTLGVQAGGSPKLTVKVFARPALSVAGLSIVRTLNAFGQPLPSVLVENVSAGAALAGAIRTDEAFGLATLTQTNAVAMLRFSEDGFLPVWRIVGANGNGVGIIPSPRLTRRDTNITVFTPIAGGAVFLDTDKKHFCILKIAVNYQYAPFSPGNIWCLYAIRYAIEKGFEICDFGRGDERYKFALGSEERFNRHVEIIRMNPIMKLIVSLRSQLQIRTRIKRLTGDCV
jgi:hypothetical protein